MELINGLSELWAETLGDSRICVAILDGPVDRFHPSLSAADLTIIEPLVPCLTNTGTTSRHGTHVASIIFGDHSGLVKGVSPHCRGLIIPIFNEVEDGTLSPCSQLDLARAIKQATMMGAHILNISGGQFSYSGLAHPILADAIRACVQNGALVVAAAGNEGCDCLNIPASLPSVLAVGAMDDHGHPLDISNWGEQYQRRGILAPGKNIVGATIGGDTTMNSGTSYSAAVVSGVAALLLSLQLKKGLTPDPQVVRTVLLASAIGCDEKPVPDCNRLLAGRLNVSGAMSLIAGKGDDMHLSDKMTGEKANLASGADDSMALEAQPTNARIQAATSEDRSTPTSENARLESDTSPFQANLHSKWERDDCTKTFPCECGGGAAGLPRLAFAIGQLGFDFGTEARRDSIMQHMDQPANPHDPKQLLAYLGKNPWDTPAIFWTINLGPTPIYVIQGQGAYAKEAYDLLRNFLEEQIKGEIERVSIPGYIEGTARLLSGHVVPVIWPVMRGMYSWNTTKLTEEVCGSTTSEEAQGVLNFFQRVYEELRNIGIMPQERAINYAATNAFQVKEVYKDAIKSGMELDTIEVGPSPFGRPDSDCWDVKLTFFQPERGFGHPRKSYRFTVDVSDVVPVTVGPMRSWFVR